MPIRFAAAVTLGFTTLLLAQSPSVSRAKPAAPPPPAPAAPPPPVVPELPPTPAQLPAHPADVAFANGMLSISANNSSLNQILREISRQTGMKITGGVVDERVFGQYGPSPASQALSTLLEGTGSNVLLVQNGGVTPAELILTPRQGGASPPNPNSASMEDNDQPDDQGPKQSSQSPVRTSVPEGFSASPQPNANSGNDPSQPQSPNGVKTPQQIYDQLQRLRQQQQQQQQQQQTNPQ